MGPDESPTARALLLLELVQNSPGITAARLSSRLGVSERAVRRYVGILREAAVPIESARGPHGGYRVGRGLRLPPLMFTTTEALGLVMAVLDGHHDAADPDDPVGSAIGKIMRVLPEPVAGPAEAIRRVSTYGGDTGASSPHPETTALLVQSCAARRRLRIGYCPGPGRDRTTDVDPWAVVVSRGRWYLLCWSHAVDARRVLRLDRVTAVDVLDTTFTAPPGLNPVQALEEHLAEGWQYDVELTVEAPAATVATWIPRSLGRCDPLTPTRTRVVATTEDTSWYAAQLTAIQAPFKVVKPPELQEAVHTVGRRFLG
ncbi:helix-turn-helix transcriptional regulator [Streptomyces sp. CA-111067]|uniref:helix-turn-helix transcriptional regulator n=1 Tax=Streptomyces sp. CA-111067 TaxID=3240046 RepID=UPI003D97D897